MTTLTTHQEQFARYFIPLQAVLLRRARQLGGSRAEANDLVQDAVERGLRAPRLPESESEFRAWMMRTLINLWIDRVRHNKVVRRIGPLPSEVVDEGGQNVGRAKVWDHLSLSDVALALVRVPEPYRTAYQRHVFDRQPYAKIARELALPVGTVGTRILRAKRCLREILSQESLCSQARAA